MLTGLGPVLASFAAVDIATFTRKLKRNALLYSVALLFLLTAYVLAVAALAIYLGQTLGLPIALLSVAGGAFFLALILMIWASAANRAEERRKREAASANSSKALMMTAALSALPAVIKSKPLLMLSAAGGLGFLMMKTMGTKRRYEDPTDY